MSLEAGVVAKIAAAVGLAGVSSAGVYYGHAYLSPKNLLSKYDRALIDFINTNSQDIVFEVKKVAEPNADFTATDLTLNSTTSSVKAKIQVSANEANNGTGPFKTASSITDRTSALQPITKLSETWTWSCELTFTKVAGADSATTIQNNERIMTANSKGLFNILKKDTTASDTSEDLKAAVKEAKVNFIKQCAKARGSEKNLKLDTEVYSTDNSPSSTKTFTFNKGPENAATQLIPQNQKDFDTWFNDSYSTKP